MRKTVNFLLGSIYNVLRLILLSLLVGILIWLSLFSVDFDFKNYDLVFTSRVNNSVYYGIEYGKDFKIWKIERFADGSLYTKKLYP